MKIPVHISEFLNNYFDKILVVSVPRFADRHERVRETLQGVSFDFFWGADKQQLNLEEVKRNGIYDEEKTKALNRHERPLNLGEVACSLSHRYVYEAMVKNGWQKVLILEDDIWPLTENLAQLPEAIKELPANWELVYFGYLKHEKVTTSLYIKQWLYKMQSLLGLMKWSYKMVSNLLPRKYSKHLKRAGFHDCTHAYAITLGCASKLIPQQEPVSYRADDLLSDNVMRGNLQAFVTEPKFFDQENFHFEELKSKIKEDQ